jgi:hypothetical protein
MRLYIEMQPLNFALTLLFYFLFSRPFYSLFTFYPLHLPFMLLHPAWAGQGQTLGQDKAGRQQGQTLVTTGTLV